MNGIDSIITLLAFVLLLPLTPYIIIEKSKFCLETVYVGTSPPSEGFHSIKYCLLSDGLYREGLCLGSQM